MQLTECFRILDVEPEAPWQVVRKSYYNLAKRCHPDLNPKSPNAENRFKEINRAFQVLQAHFRSSDSHRQVANISHTPRFTWFQRISQNPRFRKWKADCSTCLCELDTKVFQLNVHKQIQVAASTIQSGASLQMKAGREKFDIKIPSGDWNQMTVCVPGKGEASLFSKRRGDLILSLHIPQKQILSPGAASFSYEMTFDTTQLGKVMTLNSSEGPIKFVLPRNTVDRQTFSLKSGKSDSRHLLTVRFN